ncbi:phospholipase D-like domain-containing protein [Roseobacter sp. CCS2]|uniref:phospholipase D-like domain-containing protein n=1 Tax=Roseobacter sp. CCS2 TaxID=391593 RepID=UPI0000F3F105|nr:phospholipase D family protein [Roseobacter sp. CCS2]EBA11149.1 phospholipase D, putative [Roseobacter sp. CCS2]
MTTTEEQRDFEVLITAAEAYPRLEQEFLSARSEIVAGFRLFDPWTTLRSKEAQAQGTDWFDLIVHTLNRGVKIQLVITDFDPVVRMDMHYYAWRCLRGLIAAGEASTHPQNLNVRVAMHPARLGMLPRTALWWRSVKEIKAQIDRITGQDDVTVQSLLETAPDIRKLTKKEGDTLKARIFPPPALVPVTHHQKLAVFDSARLYIGGLDLNDRRYDTPKHQRDSEETWHDVQVLVTGDVAVEARTHLLQMDDGFNGRTPYRPKKLLRTMSAKRRFALPYMSPRPIISEIADAHRTAIAQSEDLIYFETQFLRDEDLARALAARATEQQALTMIIMLPAAPEDIAFTDTWGPDAAFGEHLQAKCIDIIHDAFAERVFIGSPVQPRTHVTDGRDTHFNAPIIYLHAKVSIFDDHTGILSSANLNGRSLNWDTEAGVQTETATEVAQLRQRCFDHWLGDAAAPEFYDLKQAYEAWAVLAARNAQKAPEDRQGFVVPYRVGPGKEDAQFLPGVPVEMA